MSSVNVLFLLLGAVMILAMHAGFAFLEAGTVSSKNQVNAFNKIIFDWSTTTIVYFFIGFPIAYGTFLYTSITILTKNNGYELVRFFFLLGFAAVIPAIVSGGVVGRMKFYAQSISAVLLGSLVYPFFESIAWGRIPFMSQEGSFFQTLFGIPFHDFAGSVVVHSIGGWIALPAILILGPRTGRYSGNFDTRPSSIPFLALGSWILIIGWFGFNVMSSQSIENIMCMKMVVAIVRPEAVQEVKAALFNAEIYKMTVSHVKGCGQQKGYTESYRGSITQVNLLNKVRFEVVVNNRFVKPTVDAIINAARTGNIGDGKIFVLPVEECYRIRTGEEGSEAIG